MSNKDAAVSFLRLAATGKVREAYDRFVSPNFRHHNQYFRGDRESLMLAMEEASRANPNTKIDVKRAIEEGDLVAVHSHVRHNPGDPGSPGVGVVHIFRFQNGKAVELWDLGQEISKDSPNQNGMF